MVYVTFSFLVDNLFLKKTINTIIPTKGVRHHCSSYPILSNTINHIQLKCILPPLQSTLSLSPSLPPSSGGTRGWQGGALATPS